MRATLYRIPASAFIICAAVALAVSCSTAGEHTANASEASSASNADSARPTAARRASAAPGPASPTRGALTDSISERADKGRIQGATSAPIWIVEVSDFQCPFCKTWHDNAYAAVVREYVQTGRARMAYLNMPLRMHQHAMEAAEVAMCASVQSRFWEMHEALFNTQSRWEGMPSVATYFDSLATTVGVARPAFDTCVKAHLTRPLIDADIERGKSAGIGSTPTFFVGDQKIEGAQPLPLFREVIEAQLAKAKAASGR